MSIDFFELHLCWTLCSPSSCLAVYFKCRVQTHQHRVAAHQHRTAAHKHKSTADHQHRVAAPQHRSKTSQPI